MIKSSRNKALKTQWCILDSHDRTIMKQFNAKRASSIFHIINKNNHVLFK